jgi:hypothetical protein
VATNLAGIEIPSSDPVFLAVVAIHIPLGLTCIITGALAMLSKKRRGRHSQFGKAYFWTLLTLFGSATLLAAMRWDDDYHLFVLGALSLVSAWLARSAPRRRWRVWPKVHLTGMGGSYILLLVAFYVDNGPQLPLWRDLPPFAYWLLPVAAGTPIIGWALLRHPLVRQF